MDELLIGSLVGSTLRVSVPLILCALAGVLCERSGVIDLGLEGKMLMTAFATAAVGVATGSLALAVAAALLVGVNEIAGVHGRLLPDFVAGAGFAGIAVSLIGRNHPLGIALASLLFGALYQGGSELAFEINGFSRDMVFMLQGLIVLFAGAMAQVAAPLLLRLGRMSAGGRRG